MSNKTGTKKKKDLFFEKYDLYSDANPSDTIRIKYKTLQDVKDTINKLEKLYKTGKYKHARISQVANVMTQRLRVLGEIERLQKEEEIAKSQKVATQTLSKQPQSVNPFSYAFNMNSRSRYQRY